jgi:2-dehydro-3-deoxyphosphogluconate aldolase/(4S)-4-hydroxy-2-oxoglutarate aldolase
MYMKENIIEIIKKQKLIVIIRGIDPEKVDETIKFLCFNKLNIIEFTFLHNSKNDLKTNYQIIKTAISAHPEAVIGAGTVLSKKEVKTAKEAGACFIVMPDTNPEVIIYAKKKGLLVFPGALTPSEIITAYNSGADAVKIFPSDNLGASYIKALQGPLSHIPKIAVGGIDEKNAASFLDAGCMALGVGGRLLNIKEEINKGIYSKAENRIKILLNAINGVRN